MTPIDSKGPQWRVKILDYLKANNSPVDLYVNLVDRNGWQGPVAEKAIDQGLMLLGKPRSWRVPGPAINGNGIVDVEGHPVRIVAHFDAPKATLLEHLLTPSECDELIEMAHSKGFERSMVVDHVKGNRLHHHRTSSGVGFSVAQNPLVARLERRIALLTGWPVENGEPLGALQYQPGEQYEPHMDTFDESKAGSREQLAMGGQRVGTTVVYLAPAVKGGGTRFVQTGAEVYPSKGGAIFFRGIDVAGRPDQRSTHAGMPVVEGLKYVVTLWQRESKFVSPES